MTFVDTAFGRPRWLLSLRQSFKSRSLRHRTTPTLVHLDDRLRVDVGLPPMGARPLMPHEASARISMLAWR